MITREHLDAAEGFTSCTDKAIIGDRALCMTLYRRMLAARKFEEKVIELFAAGKIHGTMHPSVGEEASTVGAAASLMDGDYLLATHRGHGQLIGKGCGVNEMMAEMLGRETGLCRGRGGSMHMADPERGVIYANGIVAANAPLAVGAALSIKKQGIHDRVAMTFMGDGAANEGAVHEAFNLASVWRVPVIFCLVNNTYGLSTPIASAMRDTDLVKRAEPFGIKTFEADGNDIFAVYETMRRVRRYCTENSEPALAVLHTYRTSGHSKSDSNLYRSAEEIDLWRSRCPVLRARNAMINRGIFTAAELDAMEHEADALIADAVRFAEASPVPDTAGVTENVFCGEGV